MARTLVVGVALALVLGIGSARGGDEDSPARRVAALEAEARRLLVEVERLKADLPHGAEATRAEIAVAAEARVGEPLPEAVLERATKDVLDARARAVAEAVKRSVDAVKKLPLSHDLAAPVVVLAVRSGAGGGNPNTVDMAGGLSNYVDERSRRPLAWSTAVDINEDSRAYVEGGRIPDGKAFAVTHVAWRGVAAGDSNGHGEFTVRVGGETLVTRRNDAAVAEGEWNGRIVVQRGRESTVIAEVANSSHVEVRIEGELIDATSSKR